MKNELTTVSDDNQLNNEHPWPGLRPFVEKNAGFFFGREQEVHDIARKIQQETLTLLFGKSGLGKTSLLRAGLSPFLHELGFVPIYIRLNHLEHTLHLEDQVEVFIEEVLDGNHIDAPRPVREETLWEYFHKRDSDWWDEENRLLKPVLIFDQFEEILTAGQENPVRAERSSVFLTELEDLIENRPPEHLLERFKTEKGLAKQYDLERIDYRVVVALREDYLADLEGLRERLRMIMKNRYRLLPLNNAQAMSVMLKPGGHLLDEKVANDIINFVATPVITLLSEGQTKSSVARQIEPALLSIILRELNNHRIQDGKEKISSELVLNRRPETILSEFYEKSLEGLGTKVRLFIEQQLLTASGARNRVAESDAIDRYGLTNELIKALIDRRIIQREKTAQMSWLELSHDTLTQVVSLSAENYRRLQRRRRYAFRSAFGLAVVAVLGLLTYLWQAYERNVQTEEAAKLALEITADLENNYTISMNGKQSIIALLDDGYDRLREYAGGSKELKERNVQFLLSCAAMDIEGGYYGKASDSLKAAQALLFDEKTERYHFKASNLLIADFELLRAEIENVNGNNNQSWRSIDNAEKLLSSAIPSNTQESMDRDELQQRLNRVRIQLLSDRGNWNEVTKLYSAARMAVSEAMSEDDAKPYMSDGDATAIRVHRLRLFSDLFRIHILRANIARMLNLSDFSDISNEFEKDLQLSKPFFKDDAQRNWTYFRAMRFTATALGYQSEGNAIKARKAIDIAIDFLADLVRSNPDNLLYRYWLGHSLLRRAEFSAKNDPLQSKVDIHAARALSITLKKDSSHPYLAFLLSVLADYREPKSVVTRNNKETDDAEKMLARVEFYRQEFAGSTYTDAWAILGYYKGVKAHIRAGNLEKALEMGNLALALLETKKDEWDAGLLANRRFWIHEAFLSDAKADDINEFQWQRHYQGALEAVEFYLKHHTENSSWSELKTYILEIGGSRYKRLGMLKEAINTYDQLAVTGLDLSMRYPDRKVVSIRTLLSIFNLIKLDHATGNWEQLADVADLLLRHVDPTSDREIRFPEDELKYWELDYTKLVLAYQDMVKLRKKFPQNDLKDDTSKPQPRNRPSQEMIDRLHKAIEASTLRKKYLEGLIDRQSDAAINRPGEKTKQLDPKSLDLSGLAKVDHKANRYVAQRPMGWRIAAIYPNATPYTLMGESLKKLSTIIDKAYPLESGRTIIRIRSSQLPFYDDGHLLTVEFNDINSVDKGEIYTRSEDEDMSDTTRFYLRSGDRILELDGKSSPIHKANKDFPIKLRTKADVASYLRFYLTFVQSENGSFLPVESAQEITWSYGVPQETKQQVENLFRPMTIWSESNQPEIWYAIATINYGNTLFHAKFTIKKYGEVKMIESKYVALNLPVNSLKFTAGRRAGNHIDRLYLDLITNINIFDRKSEIEALARLVEKFDGTHADRLDSIVNEIVALQPRLPDDMTVYDVNSDIKHYVKMIQLMAGASSKYISMNSSRFKTQISIGTEAIEKAYNNDDKLNAAQLADAYLSLSFFQIFLRDFDGALKSAARGAELDPNYLPIYTNYAHALLFLGRTDEAMAVYFEHKGKPLQGKTWEAVILSDFEQFESLGLTIPEKDKVLQAMEHTE